MDDAPREHHLEVSRTARYWTLGAMHDPDEVWFVLHGYRQLARRFLRRFEGLRAGSRLIVAPEGLSRFYVSPERGRHGSASVVGATWMTREDRDHEIRDYVAYLDRLGEVVLRGSPKVVVLGFSQGAATAARWVTYGEVGPARLVLWAGFMPPDLDMDLARARLASAELLLVRGDGDPSMTADLRDEESARLAAAGVSARSLIYSGGHEIDAETLLAIASS